MTSKLRLAFPFHRELDPHTSSLFFSVPHLKLSASLLELQYSQAHESHFHMANEDQEPHRTKKWRTGDNYPTNYRSRSSRNKAGVALSSYHKVLERNFSMHSLPQQHWTVGSFSNTPCFSMTQWLSSCYSLNRLPLLREEVWNRTFPPSPQKEPTLILDL